MRKSFYIVDSCSQFKDLSIPYKTRSEAYKILKQLQQAYGTIRFYIIEK